MNDLVKTVFKNCKVMVEDIINENGSSKELEFILYLAFSAMLIYYSTDMVNELDQVFTYTDCKYVGKDLGKYIQEKYNLTNNQVEQLENHSKYAFYDGECTINKDDLLFKRNIYVAFDEDAPFSLVLRDFIHQMNHILNSYKVYFVDYNGTMFSRMGLSLDRLNDRRSFNLRLEEAINKLQTNDIMNCLAYISSLDLGDDEIDSDLDLFRESMEYLDTNEELDTTTEIIEPLFNNDKIINTLIGARIYGNISMLKNKFNNQVGNNGFEQLLDDFSFIDNLEYSAELREEHEESAKRLIKKYNEKTNC